jgi:hypothetical protein
MDEAERCKVMFAEDYKLLASRFKVLGFAPAPTRNQGMDAGHSKVTSLPVRHMSVSHLRRRQGLTQPYATTAVYSPLKRLRDIGERSSNSGCKLSEQTASASKLNGDSEKPEVVSPQGLVGAESTGHEEQTGGASVEPTTCVGAQMDLEGFMDKDSEIDSDDDYIS